MKKILAVLLIVTAAIAAAACTSPAEGLEDKVWLLESYGSPGSLKGVLAGTGITAEFAGAAKEVSGSAGCNRYSGHYRVDGTELAIEGPVARTEIFCGNHINAQENRYLEILLDADSYSVENGRLTIHSGEELLLFMEQGF